MISKVPCEELLLPRGTCFGCSNTNPLGLGLRFFRQGQEVISRFRGNELLCGAPGILHGGILATLIDEVSCSTVISLHGMLVVTGELTVRYLAPCPVGEEIEVRARVVGRHERYFVVNSDVTLGSLPIARSTGRFFPATIG